MRSEGLGISDLSISSKTDATAALSKIDEAISTVSDQRSSIGEEMKGLNEMFRSIHQSKASSEDPISISRSRIDMEAEMKKFDELFEESRQKMINQLHPNLNPNRVLQLLR